MNFKSFHKEYFGATEGAFSKVTDRENYDSQITLTGSEADLLISHFGKDSIQIGNVKKNLEKSSKPFKYFNTGEIIHLNVNFPKPDKPELRLYISKKSGFKPEGGSIWFLFKNKNGELCIGALPDNDWSKLGQEDFDDNDYQRNIDEALKKRKIIDKPFGIIKEVTLGDRLTYYRNPKVASYSMQLSNYKCEIDSSHKTFTSQSTGLPFVEAHHFIPIKFQFDFNFSLDNVENVIALCPNCHRAIHLAVVDERYELVNKIYRKRQNIFGLNVENIAESYYNCIKL